jgi:hypothetical protein
MFLNRAFAFGLIFAIVVGCTIFSRFWEPSSELVGLRVINGVIVSDLVALSEQVGTRLVGKGPVLVGKLTVVGRRVLVGTALDCVGKGSAVAVSVGVASSVRTGLCDGPAESVGSDSTLILQISSEKPPAKNI